MNIKSFKEFQVEDQEKELSKVFIRYMEYLKSLREQNLIGRADIGHMITGLTGISYSLPEKEKEYFNDKILSSAGLLDVPDLYTEGELVLYEKELMEGIKGYPSKR